MVIPTFTALYEGTRTEEAAEVLAVADKLWRRQSHCREKDDLTAAADCARHSSVHGSIAALINGNAIVNALLEVIYIKDTGTKCETHFSFGMLNYFRNN